MSILKTLQDAAVVASDVPAVAAHFTNVPPALKTVACDVYCAVVDRNLFALNRAISDLDALGAELGADAAAARPAIDKLKSDIRIVIADLTP